MFKFIKPVLAGGLICASGSFFAVSTTGSNGATNPVNSSESKRRINPTPTNCGLSLTVNNLCVNDDDDNKNEEWDYLEAGFSQETGDLKKVTVTARASDKVDGTLILYVQQGADKITGPAGHTFWLDENKLQPATVFEWKVPAGTSKKIEYWIEGVKHSNTFEDVIIASALTCRAPFDGQTGDIVLAEVKKLTVAQADIDIDSDNNDLTNDPDREDSEDKIENSKNGDKFGKMVIINNGNCDGVPDWADGFNINSGDDEDNTLTEVEFVKVIIERKKPYTDKCEILVEYDASDPASVAFSGGSTKGVPNHRFDYSKPGGASDVFRLWKKEASEERKKEAIPMGDYLPKSKWIKWSDLGAEGNLFKTYLESIRPSGSTASQTIKVKFREKGIICEDEILLTSVELNAEPITVESAPNVVNPSGLVDGGSAGQFKIEFFPSDFKNDKIKWTVSGKGSIQGSDKGRQISVKGSGSGDGELELDIEGYYGHDPKFKFKSLSEKTINARLYIVRDDAGNNPATTPAVVNTYLTTVNALYQQAAIKIVVNHTEYINKTDWLTLGPSEYPTLGNTYDASDSELEIYCVNNFSGGLNGATGFHVDNLGMFLGMATGLNNRTLAHEIGHALGLSDIYESRPSKKIDTGSLAKESWNPSDWNGGVWFPRYYKEEREQAELVRRLIMYGYTNANKSDLPLGRVYGVTTDGVNSSTGNDVNPRKELTDVSLEDLISLGRKTKH